MNRLSARDYFDLLLLSAIWGSSFLFLRIASPASARPDISHRDARIEWFSSSISTVPVTGQVSRSTPTLEDDLRSKPDQYGSTLLFVRLRRVEY